MSFASVFNVDRTFTYHAPTPRQVSMMQDIRDQARLLARLVERLCPESRERALAFTSIQQAVMWANAAVVIHEEEDD